MNDNRIPRLASLGGEPIISVYSDKQALSDGVIVATEGLLPAVWRVNRATINLWSALTEERLGGVMTDVTRFVNEMRVAWEGGRWSEGWRIGTLSDGREVWFVENEVGGFTAMFPEDY